MKVKSGGSKNVNYLDDFLFIAMLWALCDGQMNLFLTICQRIKFPVSTRMIFLGLLIDTVTQLVLIPVEKIEKGKQLILSILQKESGKSTVQQMQ